MAMVISKFHRLIQSRVLWGFFLVIIVISFVGWGTAQSGCSSRSSERSNALGLLDGKPVPPEEFQQAYLNSRLGIALMTGRPVVATPAVEKELRQMAWRRLATLRQAQTLGLKASDVEVVAAIQQQPMFQAGGKFSAGQYENFVQQVLGNLGVNELGFENYLREELVLQKVRGAVNQALLIPPADLQRSLSALGDQFTFDYTAIAPAAVTGVVQVAPQDVRAYYASHTNEFEVPEKVVVQVVEFAASNYLAQVQVSDQEAMDYYNEHMDRFSKAVLTNAPAVGTNQPEQISQTVTQPFDEVKSNLVAELKFAAARAHAADAAAEFVTSLVPDRKGHALTFAQAAAKAKLTIRRVGPFAELEPVPGIEAGLVFNRAAFARRDSAEERFSDPIPGRQCTYVLQLEQRLPARIPAFEEVADRVAAAARAAALQTALEQKAKAVRAAFQQAAPGHAALAQALQPLGLAALTETGSYIQAASSTNVVLETLLQGAMMLNPGEVTEVLAAKDGRLLVARVAQRQPGDAATLSELTPQIMGKLASQRSRALDVSYEDYLLQKSGFRDRQADLDKAAAEEQPDDAVPRQPAVPIDAL